MFELIQLEQLLAIEKYETLSKTSEALNLSQPALSRSMQRLEKELQVSLFTRQKNKITFNENGILALDYAKRIIGNSVEMKEALQAHEKSQHTISIGSCAPGPVWKLIPDISRLFPYMTIQSEMKIFEELDEGLQIKNTRLSLPQRKRKSLVLYVENIVKSICISLFLLLIRFQNISHCL